MFLFEYFLFINIIKNYLNLVEILAEVLNFLRKLKVNFNFTRKKVKETFWSDHTFVIKNMK